MTTIAPIERAEVAAACLRLAEQGLLIGTAGNVSLRFGDLVAITATGAVLAEVCADDVTVVDLAGTVVAGRYAPTSELGLHLDVYRAYATQAIVHTHAPKSTAIACVLDELPVIHYQQLLLGGSTKVAPFHPFGTAELADAVREALRGRQSALLANHGAVTLGMSMDKAVESALLLEWACALYLDAMALGTPRELSARQQAAVVEVALRTGYGTRKPLEKDTP
ncbi:class II aldolase/adducin family protein [Nocardia sp. NBC_00565]|uniref:class II aldolase/adducin family protein n=1 Tax=Nocardia sp. NBC_00565 TaxID=2975993 RepID=UPI002E801E1B|nr:class II aldolase/adducin family protein [Nocardia sp. NBC_00565]WUC06940.1 class II aldolase/adducin family protein [Nocardia sp. NBC_00565]